MKIQGWPLYALVLALQQLMTEVVFFPADSHLHFPVYCVVSRPFQRKATRDSWWWYIQSLFTLCRIKNFENPFNSSSTSKLPTSDQILRKTVGKSSLFCFDEKLADIFVLLCFDEKNLGWRRWRKREKARACFKNNHNDDFFVKSSGMYSSIY